MRGIPAKWALCLLAFLPCSFAHASNDALTEPLVIGAPSPILAAGPKEKQNTKVARTKPAPSKNRSVESLPVESAPKNPAAREQLAQVHGTRPNLDPHFSVLFDLILAFQPGKADFSFLNYHPLLLLEVTPAPDLQFSFDVKPSPSYYELDWNATPWMTLRLGKIWIPFDDLNPHNMFGGFINTSRLRLGTTYFLPDIWADLGIGARFQIVDKMNFSLTGDLYVVNGFGSLQQEGPRGEIDYPNLSDTGIAGTDGNSDKAIGMRVAAKFFQKLSVGASFYTGRWSLDTHSAARLTMLGLDAQLRFPSTEFKFGFVTMPTSLIAGASFTRIGQYVEANYKFGANNEWRALLRLGYVDTDDRFTDANDVLTLGGGIRWRPGVVQFALEHYQDLKNPAMKAGTALTFLRTIVML